MARMSRSWSDAAELDWDNHPDDEGNRMLKKGLYEKYVVLKDGKPVTGFSFVLRPERDYAARRALRTYAAYTENYELAGDLVEYLDELELRTGSEPTY